MVVVGLFELIFVEDLARHGNFFNQDFESVIVFVGVEVEAFEDMEYKLSSLDNNVVVSSIKKLCQPCKKLMFISI